MSVTDIVMTYQALVFSVINVKQMLSNLPDIIYALTIGHEVITLIDRKPLIVSKQNSVSDFKINDGIKFDDVHFRYPTA